MRFCGVSPFRKILLSTTRFADEEKCTSRQFITCPLTAGRPEVESGAGSCPFFRESLVQFCAAAPATRFIPYSETLLSCCQSEGHRYCDLFLNQAEPERAAGVQTGGTGEGTPRVDGIDLPLNLAFSPNHMWLDVSEDGSCHLGADAFLAKVIGKVEKVSFVARANVCQPIVVLRVYGVDLTLAFPGRVSIGRSNVHLRRDPDRVVSDPYGRGWLFEGRVPADPYGRGWLLEGRVPADLAADGGAFAHLYRGKEALAWMKSETERMTRFVHEILSQAGPEGRRLLNDGGAFNPPIVPHLAPEDRMLLFNTFFSLDRLRRSS
ncbi:MAG: hypothetical protein A3F84_27840 [Candidatus Handelsmanbacteria bacterium RIFCSPLOWO2_12_FULL_64_10]|uniref:Uncharacterized protein n=1 Tax=Handelsmanbacteria sp. (strain RIFCSPLOWO2_12_FULL_64_10) TaxID=1817868 RepID=A0A1F6C4S9_HANXR|nr:MAG: hypothetical protein A3F84_27840 [Candidatus Handelsmanbacteria bacterium RIFCSPLOWO2_12_FULL_64_10]